MTKTPPFKDTTSPQEIIIVLESINRIFQTKNFKSNQSNIIKDIENFSSFGQLRSKTWLLEILKDKKLLELGVVFLCAGWYGLLPFFLLNDKAFFIKQIFNFEIDPLSVQVSEDLNRRSVQDNWKFKAVLKNIMDLNYQQDHFDTLKANGEIQPLTAVPNTIINTACEHIDKFSKWWDKLPPKKLIILQSNDFLQQKEHCNCVSSLEEFKKQAPMDLIFEGELDLRQYKRFMLIGYKTRQEGAV